MSPLPIYIISLKRTPERRLYMQRQLDVLNLNYQFVEAIDKYDLYSEARRTSIARQLDIDRSDMESIYKNCKNIGPVACMLSHLKVHGLMAKRNISKACILEDDSLILSSFPEILAACQKMRMPDYLIPGYASQNLEIDHITRYLYILVSPCIRAAPKYMTHSARIS